jgi:hydrogenase-4 component B
VYAIGAGFILLVVALVGGLAIFTFVKMFSAIFLGRARTSAAEHVTHVSFFEVLSPLIAAIGLAVVGLIAFPKFAEVSNLLAAHPWVDTVAIAPGGESSAWGIYLVLALVMALLVMAISVVTRKTTVRITDTWDCGQPIDASMQYTSTGFAAPIRFFFRALVLSKKQLVSIPVVATNPWITVKELHWSTASIYEQWLYLPIGRFVLFASSWVKRLQSGVIQLYVLLVVVALIAVMIAAL